MKHTKKFLTGVCIATLAMPIIAEAVAPINVHADMTQAEHDDRQAKIEHLRNKARVCNVVIQHFNDYFDNDQIANTDIYSYGDLVVPYINYQLHTNIPDKLRALNLIGDQYQVDDLYQEVLDELRPIINENLVTNRAIYNREMQDLFRTLADEAINILNNRNGNQPVLQYFSEADLQSFQDCYLNHKAIEIDGNKLTLELDQQQINYVQDYFNRNIKNNLIKIGKQLSKAAVVTPFEDAKTKLEDQATRLQNELDAEKIITAPAETQSTATQQSVVKSDDKKGNDLPDSNKKDKKDKVILSGDQNKRDQNTKTDNKDRQGHQINNRNLNSDHSKAPSSRKFPRKELSNPLAQTGNWKQPRRGSFKKELLAPNRRKRLPATGEIENNVLIATGAVVIVLATIIIAFGVKRRFQK